MAVTDEKSTQLANIAATPRVINPACDDGARDRVKRFSFTQGAAAGDANSLQRLAKIAAGTVALTEIEVEHSAFGAARVLSFGHDGYTELDGTVVAADYTAFASGLDVSAAGNSRVHVGYLDAIASRSGFDLVAQVTAGTIPIAATVKGHVKYGADS